AAPAEAGRAARRRRAALRGMAPAPRLPRGKPPARRAGRKRVPPSLDDVRRVPPAGPEDAEVDDPEGFRVEAHAGTHAGFIEPVATFVAAHDIERRLDVPAATADVAEEAAGTDRPRQREADRALVEIAERPHRVVGGVPVAAVEE